MAQEAAGDHHGGQIRLEHQRAAHRLHHDHGLDPAGAEAAIVFGKGQAEQALLGELAPHRSAPAALLRHVLLAGFEIIGVGQQAIDALFQEPLLLGQIKIHFVFLVPRNSLLASFRDAPKAQARNPYSRSWLWIPGSPLRGAPE